MVSSLPFKKDPQSCKAYKTIIFQILFPNRPVLRETGKKEKQKYCFSHIFFHTLFVFFPVFIFLIFLVLGLPVLALGITFFLTFWVILHLFRV